MKISISDGMVCSSWIDHWARCWYFLYG